MNNFPRLVIAGLKGGSGKTTLSLGLIRALREKGLKVVPFKKGPDYIDAGWLAGAAGHPCYNLDPFMIGSASLLSSFITHAKGSDVAIIEGNRGLFDGMDEDGSYSTAETAKILRSPVVLIVDCTKVTRTVAAMVLGVERFDENVAIKGIVLNQLAGSRHESVIRKSIKKYCNAPVIGALPKLSNENFPERHMGLVPFQEHPEVEQAIQSAAEIVKKYVDIESLLMIAKGAGPVPEEGGKEQSAKGIAQRAKSVGQKKSMDSRLRGNDVKHYAPSPMPLAVKIGVIRDSAFQFYYPENFEELRRNGAEIIEVSALDETLLPDIDALYIGGGFPETHAIALAENVRFRDSLRRAVMEGLPVYAECGGLMYLGEGLLLENRTYPMTGIFPLVFSLEKKPQAHGYSIVEVVEENPFYPEGTILRGHEFHYSKPVNTEKMNGFYYAFRMKRGHGIYGKMDGVCFNNVLATYTHLHALGARGWGEGMVRRATEFRDKKLSIRKVNR